MNQFVLDNIGIIMALVYIQLFYILYILEKRNNLFKSITSGVYLFMMGVSEHLNIIDKKVSKDKDEDDSTTSK